MKIRLSAALLALSFFAIPFPTRAQAVFSSGSLVALANQDRVQNNDRALTEDPLLDRAAQRKADNMAALGYFSHIDASGRTPWHWFTEVGYYYLRAGENLAVNFDDAQSLEAAWMHSPSHRANILKKNYTRIGIGIARGLYQGKLATFVVQFFATPAPRTVATVAKS